MSLHQALLSSWNKKQGCNFYSNWPLYVLCSLLKKAQSNYIQAKWTEFTKWIKMTKAVPEEHLESSQHHFYLIHFYSTLTCQIQIHILALNVNNFVLLSSFCLSFLTIFTSWCLLIGQHKLYNRKGCLECKKLFTFLDTDSLIN